MKYPEISDSIGWIKYYRWQWENYLNDNNSPNWLKELAKDELSKEY
jgi:hypothetical protein